jgi:hypothetical protein
LILLKNNEIAAAFCAAARFFADGRSLIMVKSLFNCQAYFAACQAIYINLTLPEDKY